MNFLARFRIFLAKFIAKKRGRRLRLLFVEPLCQVGLWAAITKCHILDGLTKNYFLLVLEATSLQSECQHGQVLVFLACTRPPSCCGLTWQSEGSGVTFSSYKNPLPSRAGEGNSTPLQYSCLENPTDGGAW